MQKKKDVHARAQARLPDLPVQYSSTVQHLVRTHCTVRRTVCSRPLLRSPFFSLFCSLYLSFIPFFNPNSAVTMDPERVRGYLQVACAGLGFDIGEIWWTSNESGTSTLATIGTSRCCTTDGSLAALEFALVSE
jgi:hypothetical protein